MINLLDRISSSPNIMLGKPVIKGTRLTVEFIITKLSEGASEEELLLMYPNLIKEDILAALSYSAKILSKEEPIAS